MDKQNKTNKKALLVNLVKLVGNKQEELEAIVQQEQLELDYGDDTAEWFWVRMRGKDSKAGVMVGVCYRPPQQDEEADEIF